jgi:exosortase/archaeosortase family protein
MPKPIKYPLDPALAAALSLGGGLVALRWQPALETEVFARGAAGLAGLFLGVPTVRMGEGWALPFAAQPVLVTNACSATDFYLMAAAVLGWHLMRRVEGRPWMPLVAAAALLAALPVTFLVNALRIVAVAHAQHWVISRLPASYDAFLHMLTGVSVFLPALIALNLILELYGRSATAARD